MVSRPFTVLDAPAVREVYLSSICRTLRARQVALPCAGQHSRGLQPDFELVHLAIEYLRRKAEDVLAMQLLRDARERRREFVRLLQEEEAAAGLLGQPLQPAIGTRPYFPRPIEVLVLEANR